MRVFITKKEMLGIPAGAKIEVVVDMGRLGTFWDGYDIPLSVFEKETDWFEEIKDDNT